MCVFQCSLRVSGLVLYRFWSVVQRLLRADISRIFVSEPYIFSFVFFIPWCIKWIKLVRKIIFLSNYLIFTFHYCSYLVLVTEMKWFWIDFKKLIHLKVLIYLYLTTPSHKQDLTQGQCLTVLNSVFSYTLINLYHSQIRICEMFIECS